MLYFSFKSFICCICGFKSENDVLKEEITPWEKRGVSVINFHWKSALHGNPHTCMFALSR